jgi:hypothetical protein
MSAKLRAGGEPVLVDGVRFDPSIDDIAERIHLEAYPELEPQVRELVDAARDTARPRAVYRICEAQAIGAASTTIGGVRFENEAVARMVAASARGGASGGVASGRGDSPAEAAPVTKVVIYLATCGPELDALDLSDLDPIAAYWLLVLKEMALSAASTALRARITRALAADSIRVLHPGAHGRDVWAISDQRKVFSLLADVPMANDPAADAPCAGMPPVIGVRLSESCIMSPDKSVSGLATPATPV